ncbi:MAG: sialidase family protein [Thermodesulforhabdaceae bacterium]
MARFLRSTILITIASLFIIAATTVSFALEFNEESFEKYKLDLQKPRYISISPDENIWIHFTTAENAIIAKSLKSKDKDFVINDSGKPNASGSIWAFQKDYIYFVWREKSDDKSLVFRSLNLKDLSLSSPIVVDKDSQPLTRIKLGATEKGLVKIVWYGEKADSKGRRYSIYSADSKDFGKSFTKTLDLTPQSRASLYPSLLVDEKGNSYMFTEVVNENGREMIFRKDTGKGWEEPVSLGKVGVVSLYIRPLKVGNRIMVFWFNSYEGTPVTEMAYSDDEGKTWERKALEVTRGLDLTGMQAVSGGEGQSVYLAISGVDIKVAEKDKDKKEEQEDVKKRKDTVYLLYSHDGGKTFSNLIHLRHYPYSHTRANLPNIAARGKDLVVAWTDYRNIRSNIYMNYSKDGGITWQKEDIPLEEPGKFNTVLHWDVNNLVSLKDKYYLLCHRFKDDSMDVAYPVIIEFKIDK